MTQLQPLDAQEKIAWLRLSRTDRVGPVAFSQLLAMHGNASAALEALPNMAKRGGKKPLEPYERSKAETEMAAIEKLGATLVASCEASYPEALRHISDAPPLITLRGDAGVLATKSIAIVGARNASANALRLTQTITKDLVANYGQVVVSGLARGVDTAAHGAAISTKPKASTIAVLAGGVDVVYPPENQKLYDAIVAGGGCIVAESSLGHPPRAHDFPRRNRIISGMSQATIVVEATLKSGSLITAQRAADQGREVMAVPGFPMDPRAKGPNKLLKQGATLVENADDVMHALNTLRHDDLFAPLAMEEEEAYYVATPDGAEYARIQSALFDVLGYHATAFDVVLQQLSCNASALSAVLLEMELGGAVQRHPGNRYSLLG